MLNDRAQMLRKLQEASFAIDDVKLFLNTHPDNQEALDYYNKQKELRKQYMEEFTSKFGPISAYDVDTKNGWTWIDNPWPWEMEAN